MPYSPSEKETIYAQWRAAVNMAPEAIVTWLTNAAAEAEALSSISARLQKKVEKWTDDDFEISGAETAVILRTLDMEPGPIVGDTDMSSWQLSLANLGHDVTLATSPAYEVFKSWEKPKRVILGGILKLKPGDRTKINRALNAKGLDGNKSFASIGAGWSEAFEVLRDADITTDHHLQTIPKDSGRQTAILRPIGEEGAEFENTMLVFTWYRHPSGNYECTASLS